MDEAVEISSNITSKHESHIHVCLQIHIRNNCPFLLILYEFILEKIFLLSEMLCMIC